MSDRIPAAIREGPYVALRRRRHHPCPAKGTPSAHHDELRVLRWLAVGFRLRERAGTLFTTRLKRDKESRFRKQTNHCISKEIVATAERSRSAIAVLRPEAIRKRVKARKQPYARMTQSFANSRPARRRSRVSRLSPPIPATPDGHVPNVGRSTRPSASLNRRSSCVDCGYTAAAGFVGARNIRASGAALVTSAPLSSPLGTNRGRCSTRERSGQKPPVYARGWLAHGLWMNNPRRPGRRCWPGRRHETWITRHATYYNHLSGGV
jgi:hypothetical protein